MTMTTCHHCSQPAAHTFRIGSDLMRGDESTDRWIRTCDLHSERYL